MLGMRGGGASRGGSGPDIKPGGASFRRPVVELSYL